MRLFWSRGSSSSEGWKGQYELEVRLGPRHPGVLGHRWGFAGAGRNHGGQCVPGNALPPCVLESVSGPGGGWAQRAAEEWACLGPPAPRGSVGTWP